MQISETFVKAIDLLLASGFKNINKLPGCAELNIDDHWWIAVNGHNKEIPCSKDVGVAPFTMYVEFNGWPAGVIDSNGGILAAGEAANEVAFLAAIEEATKRIWPCPQTNQ